jgi:hypothetical protein
MDSSELAEAFAKLLGARVVTCPSPTPEQIAEMERREAELCAMSDAQIIALWEAADETRYCCDDIWAEGQRRGLGGRVCI